MSKASKKLASVADTEQPGGNPDSILIQSEVSRVTPGEPCRKGGIFKALRRSPLVGADLDLDRPTIARRKADLP